MAISDDNLEELKDFLELLSNDYTTRNDYGRSYDNYYTMYNTSDDIKDPENVYNKAKYFLNLLK